MKWLFSIALFFIVYKSSKPKKPIINMLNPEEVNWSEIVIDGSNGRPISIFPNNTVISARYHPLTLVPRNLFEQFQRLPNIWFLLISVFQLVNWDLNPVNSWTTIAPLTFLLFISLIKVAKNEYNRHKEDIKINSVEYLYWNGTTFEKIKCGDLEVGMFVLVNDGETVPADMILLACSNESCKVYIDTTSVIGNGNLIEREALSETQKFLSAGVELGAKLEKMYGSVKVEEANSDISSFQGLMILAGHPKGIDVNIQQLLVRGSVLKNTTWALGFVVYAGENCKIQMNIRYQLKKTSNLEKRLNKWVIYILLFEIILVIISMFLYFYASESSFGNYIFPEALVVFLILYSNIFPISLFVVMDIIRLFQCKLISYELSENVDVKCSDVNENLGQVEYIITDKTGTLTENQLMLKACFIGLEEYIDEEYLSDVIENRGSAVSEEQRLTHFKTINEISSFTKHTYKESYGQEMHDHENTFEKFRGILEKEDSSSLKTHFVRCLAMCNSLTIQWNKYYGPSADEIALAEGAVRLGFILRNKLDDQIELEGPDGSFIFTVIDNSEFDPETQISKIIVKENGEENAYLYIKGSQIAMSEHFEQETDLLNTINTQIDRLGKSGLRTMILAYRKLSPSELAEFQKKVQAAKNSLLNQKLRIENAYKDLEENLNFLGITGIEDVVLQDTKATINDLREAGIKIWMASGDNENSCISAARTCQLITHEPIIKLQNLAAAHQVYRALQNGLENYVFHGKLRKDERRDSISNYIVSDHNGRDIDDSLQESQHADKSDAWQSEKLDVRNSSQAFKNNAFKKFTRIGAVYEDIDLGNFTPSQVDFVVSCDRMSFRNAVEDDKARKLLVALLFTAKFVCFSGMMPKDKSDVVKLLKTSFDFDPVVLAVGDGNSDIAMLQEADIGIGITGKEESQAKNYAELSISHFAFLKKLLLVHGHWNYSKMSQVVLLFLYKNFLMTMIIFGFFLASDYSGFSIFNGGLIVGFNIFYTILPIISLGIFNQRVSSEQILLCPQIYSKGINNEFLNWKKLLFYIILGLIHTAAVFLLVVSVNLYIVKDSGFTSDLFLLEFSLYPCMVLTVLCQIWKETNVINWITITQFIFSIGLMIGYLSITNAHDFTSSQLRGAGDELNDSPANIAAIIIIPLICYVISSSYDYIHNFLLHGDFEASRIMPEIGGKFNRLKNYASNLEKIYVESSAWKNEMEVNGFQMKKYSMHFYAAHIERKYRERYTGEHLMFFRKVFFQIAILLAAFTIAVGAIGKTRAASAGAIITFSQLVALGLSFTKYFKQHYIMACLFWMCCAILVKFIMEMSFQMELALITCMLTEFSYFVFDVNWMAMTSLNIINVFLYIISCGVSTYGSGNSSEHVALDILTYCTLVLSITITSSISSREIEKSKRMEQKLLHDIEAEFESNTSILSQLLPSFIRNRVKEGTRYIAEDQGEVTVVFCDICDFDKICKEYTPEELTSFLDSFFQTLDQMCETNGITKIETVGKTYMACAGLRDFDTDLSEELAKIPHTRRAIEMSLAILDLVQNIELKFGGKLQVKIGINSGKVTAGVVGHHKPQFSLVGDTVNTASRMCSTIDLPNQIQITTEAYNSLGDTKGLSFLRNEVEAKGKGIMKTFFVYTDKNSEQFLDSNIMEPMKSGKKSSFMVPSLGNITTAGTRNSYSANNEGENSTKRTQETFREKFEVTLKSQNEQNKAENRVINFNFQETENEKDLRLAKTKENARVLFYGLIIALVTYCLLLLYYGLKYGYISGYDYNSILIGRILDVAFLLICLLARKKWYKLRFFPLLIVLCLFWLLIVVIFNISYNTAAQTDMSALEIMYLIVILSHVSDGNFITHCIALIVIFFSWLGFAVDNGKAEEYALNIVIVASSAFINIIASYTREKKARINFNLAKAANLENQKTEQLLSFMMPKFVLEKYKQFRATTDRLFQVTLLFADIVGFTAWSSDKTPIEVVEMLSNLFTRFDKKCIEFNVYKVHTIGDCYVVMGITNDIHRDVATECLNMLKMAQAMINIINQVNEEHNSSLNMRIGLHTGEVIAGIIGTTVVRYDIYGPDMLLANKMESGGEAGKINVSEVTREILDARIPDKLQYTFNRETVVKSIDRVVKSYFVTTPSDLFLL
ncbi:unnamed protein product [Blepharisma stoltei]|uniref:P-type phospholipid transporter n=1 Tax=Blepharisma stoltei TaxID=1481888 RepID=A0AAU9J0N6_9CILI|nr:unnamed protein product [Blepharisma stoltei]